MNDQIQDNRVRILEMQVMECKKEINLILEANERYFYLIESLIKFLANKNDEESKLNNKELLDMKNFRKDLADIKDEIIFLKDEIKSIQSNEEKVHNKFIDISNSNSEDINKLEEIIKDIYRPIGYNDNDTNDNNTNDNDTNDNDTSKIEENSQEEYRDFNTEDEYIDGSYQIDRFSSEHIENKESQNQEIEEEEKRSSLSSFLFNRDE